MATDVANPPAPTPTPADAPKPSFTQRMVELAKGAVQPPAPNVTKPVTPAAPAAPTPTSTPPPAADPDDEIVSGKRSPKNEDFKRVKTARDEFRKQADELAAKHSAAEKELTELRKAPKHNAELIKTIEKERDDYRAKYDSFIVQFTPEFQQRFDTQKSQVLEVLKGTIPQAQAESLAQLFELPNSEAKRRQISEITDGFDQFQIGEVVAANREIQRIEAERKAAMANATKTIAGISEERTKQAQAKREAADKAFEESLSKATENFDAFKKRENDAPWNANADKLSKVARTIYNGEFENDAERAQSSIMAALAPSVLETHKVVVAAKDKEIAELKETVAKLQGTQPGFVPPTGGEKAANTSKTPFTDRFTRQA